MIKNILTFGICKLQNGSDLVKLQTISEDTRIWKNLTTLICEAAQADRLNLDLEANVNIYYAA